MGRIDYYELIKQHYISSWECEEPSVFLYDKGPFDRLPHDFRVLEFPPRISRNMWTYATCCMSQSDDHTPIELHIFSTAQDRSIIELLTALVYYHRNTKNVGLNHTVNFGRPWKENSNCSYGLISLPYIDGPSLENFTMPESNKIVKFYWLIPVTEEEVLYKRKFGIESLEEKFGNAFNYLDPVRRSMI